MLEAIIKHLRQNKYGVSNVIVAMLSLVLIVVIVANVVPWSYQMNQFDWERMQERIEMVEVKSGELISSWFVAQNDYAIDVGSRVSGSYADAHLAENGF
jgi:Ni,Fe-hydrogenase I large subunit